MATPEAQHALDVARRRRKGPGSPGIPIKNSSDLDDSHAEQPLPTASSGGFKVLDLVRILGGVFLLSSVVSYFVTGESILWGYRPWYTQPSQVLRWVQGPVRLTDEELKAYDGSVEGRPIYLGLNGTIYDVTAGARMYGPGGSYHVLAGRDAARAYVTGCFEEDLSPDLRGVEEMFIPIDPDTDPASAPSAEVETGDELKRAGGKSGVKKSELKIRREKDLRVARKKVHDTIEGWAVLFRGDRGKPYFKVGEIVREPDWLKKLPKRRLCEQAQKGRPKRVV